MHAILLYWFAAQQQTSTSRQQKIGWFDVKFSAKSNEFDLFFLKATGSGRKTAKIKVVRKNAKRRHSEVKG